MRRNKSRSLSHWEVRFPVVLLPKPSLITNKSNSDISGASGTIGGTVQVAQVNPFSPFGKNQLPW